MLFKENVEKLLEDLNLPKVELDIYTNLILNIWKVFEPVYSGVDDSHNEKHIYHVLKRCMKMVHWLKFNSRNFTDDKESRYILKLSLAAISHDAFSYTSRKQHHVKAYEFIRKLVDIKVIEGNHIDPLTKAEKVFSASQDALKFLYFQKLNLSHTVDYSSYIVASEPCHDRTYENIKYLDTFLNSFSKYDLLEVSDMVQQHRASYEGNFTSELCEIFSAADRDDLDLNVIINRIYTCALNEDNKFECDINGYKRLIIFRHNGPVDIYPIILRLKEDGWDNKLIKTFYHLCEKFSRDGYAYSNLKEDGFYKTYYKNHLEDFWKAIDNVIFMPTTMLKYIKNLNVDLLNSSVVTNINEYGILSFVSPKVELKVGSIVAISNVKALVNKIEKDVYEAVALCDPSNIKKGDKVVDTGEFLEVPKGEVKYANDSNK